MIAFVMTILSWLVTVVILGWLAAKIPTAAGLALGAAGVGVGVGCLVRANQIYERQKKEAIKAEERSRAFIEGAAVKVHEERTGQPATPEMRAEFKAAAGAAATILGSYVNPNDFFYRLAAGQDPWVSLTPNGREALEKEAGERPKPDKQEKPGGSREEDEK
jgi:hypothetical protein